MMWTLWMVTDQRMPSFRPFCFFLRDLLIFLSYMQGAYREVLVVSYNLNRFSPLSNQFRFGLILRILCECKYHCGHYPFEKVRNGWLLQRRKEVWGLKGWASTLDYGEHILLTGWYGIYARKVRLGEKQCIPDISLVSFSGCSWIPLSPSHYICSKLGEKAFKDPDG